MRRDPSPALEPAASVIAKFGGPQKVQDITKADRTRVFRWTQPREAGGTDGRIPMKQVIKLIEHARKHDIPISGDEFFMASAPRKRRGQ